MNPGESVHDFLLTNKQKITELLIASNKLDRGIITPEHNDILIGYNHQLGDSNLTIDSIIIFQKSQVKFEKDEIHIIGAVAGAYHVADWNVNNSTWELEESQLSSDTFEDNNLLSVYTYPSFDSVKIVRTHFGLLYSKSYEGYKLPDVIAKQFNIRKYDYSDRDDQEIVKAVLEHRKNCNNIKCNCNNIGVEWICVRYKKYWDIDEYDGMETIVINDSEYERDRLQEAYKILKQHINKLNSKLAEKPKLMALTTNELKSLLRQFGADDSGEDHRMLVARLQSAICK